MSRFIATFGAGQLYEGYYVEIKAHTYNEAVQYMEDKYDGRYCMVYSENHWQEWVTHANKLGLQVEKKLKEVIIVDL